MGAGAVEKALRTTEHPLSGQDSEGAPTSVHLAQRLARLSPYIQLAPDLTPTPSRAFYGDPIPFFCPSSSACLDLLAAGTHHKCGRDRLWAGPTPEERSPPLGKPDRPQHKANWAIPETPGTASLIPKDPSQVTPSWPGQPGTEALSCPGLRSQFPRVHLSGLGTQGWAHSLQQPEGLCQVLGSHLGAHCPGGLGGPEGIPHPGSGG